MRTNSLLKVGLITVVMAGLNLSCATTKDSKDSKSSGGSTSFSGGGKSSGGGGGDDDIEVSANRVTLTSSLSNNSLTSRTISTSKADGLISRLSAGSKDPRTLEARISAQRLARKNIAQILDTSKRLADLEMAKKGANREVPAIVKLELALGAINSKKFALAEYYLQDLFTSKNPRVRAGAYNALGVISLLNDRIPTAVANFKEALKSISSYEPAQLNLGFIALVGGDIKTAKQAFSSMQNDWFVQTGLISIARLEGNKSRANSLCQKLLSRNHKPTLFNCALFEYQTNKNFGKAKQLLNRALKSKGGSSGWNSLISKTLSKVNFEEAQFKKKQKKPSGKPSGKPPGK